MEYGKLVEEPNAVPDCGTVYKFQENQQMPYWSAKKLFNDPSAWRAADEQTKIAAVLSAQRWVNMTLRVDITPVFYYPSPFHPVAACQPGVHEFSSHTVAYNLMYLNAPELCKSFPMVIAHESRHYWQKEHARKNKHSKLYRKIRNRFKGKGYNPHLYGRFHDFYYTEKDANKFAKRFCRNHGFFPKISVHICQMIYKQNESKYMTFKSKPMSYNSKTKTIVHEYFKKPEILKTPIKRSEPLRI